MLDWTFQVPTFAYEKRLSRIETLRLAITYISFMDEILTTNSGNTSSSSSGGNNNNNAISIPASFRSPSGSHLYNNNIMYPAALHRSVCH